MTIKVDFNPNQYEVEDRADLFVIHKRNFNQTDDLGYNKIEELVSPIQDKTILDYGCGNGDNSRKFSNLGARLVIGVDASESMLEGSIKDGTQNVIYDTLANTNAAERTVRGVILKKIDYDNKILPKIIPDNFLDAAVSYYVFCEIGDLEKIKSIFTTIAQKLKTGGKLLIQMPNRDKFNGKESYGFKCYYKEDLKDGDVVQTILRTNNGDIDTGLLLNDYYRSQETLAKSLMESGFHNVHIHELLAKGDDSQQFVDEVMDSPIYIIEAVK